MFCHLFGEIAARQEYEFLCPESGKWAAVTPARGGEPVKYPPQGAVQVSPKSVLNAAA